MAEENPNVQEVVQPQEAIQEPEHVPKVEETNVKSDQSDKDYNFKQLREQIAQLREEKEASRNPEPKAAEPSQELGEDDLVEGRHLNAHFKKIEEMFLRRERNSVPDQLRTKHADFDSVVSNENVENFRQTEPELFEALQAQDPDLLSGRETYSKGVALYKMMKSCGYGNSTSAETKAKIESNMSKPGNVQSVQGGNTALSEAQILSTQGLTQSLKEKYYREAVEATKRG